jgi:hypothetical protein
MRTLKILALPVLMLPLIGSTCTADKLVTLSIGFPTTARFVAEGSTNQHDDSQIVDVKTDLDIEGALADADIDVNDLEDDAVKIVQVFYRVIQPDQVANRTIVNGDLTVSMVDDQDQVISGPFVAVNGFSFPAGIGNVANPTEWIDITPELGTDGVTFMNQFLVDCLQELKGTGPGPASGRFRYDVSGTSAPPMTETYFEWEIKFVFQGTVQKQFEVPFG